MSSQGTKNQRQEQAAATRQKLLTSAQHLFAQNGYKGTTVRMINRSVDLADGLLYHYFPGGKKEIFKEVITGNMQEMFQELQEPEKQDVYEKLVEGYTRKQWGRECKDLPAFIIKRLPLRFIYDNNYFNDRFQGIPMGGYTAIVEKMLEGSDVLLNTDYYEFRKENADIAEKTVYTGMLDKYFDYKYGVLEYRSVRFETETLDMDNYQGNAVVNYTEREVPYTRIIEHKHFEYGTQPKTVISREYPSEWKLGEEPYYPVNNEKNEEVAGKYRELADKEENVIFGGRLGEYRYYDMDKVIAAALKAVEKEKNN